MFDVAAREVSVVAERQQNVVAERQQNVVAERQQATVATPSTAQPNVDNNHLLHIYNQLLSDDKTHHHDALHIQIYSADIEKEVANVLFSLKRYDEALVRYQHAYTILKRALGENHPKAARAIWGKLTPQYNKVTHM